MFLTPPKELPGKELNAHIITVQSSEAEAKNWKYNHGIRINHHQRTALN
jgi:hypothetical protein